ncbi:SDR family NAD(P)-dependent oxidoreductase [Dactylosporangium sp. NPDC051541]|uniref:type I polyketide synthase n=1 Tax=Dactylosporangium sp. NPDC051541 TaxID=3363977 RepID=UPI00379A7C42
MNDTDTAGGVEPIAVIGMACRLPGAADLGQYWDNLVRGVESVRFPTREEQLARGVPAHLLDDTNFVRATSLLDGMDEFDAAFFSIGAREAELRDPQQRTFLELSHTALEDAGYDPQRYPGEVGVYGAIGSDAYQWMNIRRNPRVFSAAGDMAVMVASHPHYLATLVSYKLNLRGPSMTVSTACSSSLVAVHLACEALRNGECEMALAGGVSFELPPAWGYMYDDDGVLSPDGHSRVFDAGARGTIWGSGGGIVVLKRLADAVADGDHVRAVVLGNAVNNDGAAKVGFSAPSAEGQAAAIAQAQGVAGVDPRTVTYVEAHGTATPLGDPIEVSALSTVFGRGSDDTGWCGIGSVKTNFGHLGPAAGIAGLIKTALALQHGLIPPSLHFERPNEKIDFAGSPFYVNATLSKWETDGLPRRAGVSSFGIGGTNAHIVMEEPPPGPSTAGDGARAAHPAHVLQLSARTDTALQAAVERLAAHLAERPGLDLADVAHTLRIGRRGMLHRAALVAADTADAAAGLSDPKRVVRAVAPKRPAQVALLFSGQGAQYAGMGAELYATEPVYRAAVDRCAELLREPLGLDLRDLLHGAEDDRLRPTAIAQPALFTVGYALARLWQSWGVEPAAMLGHSIGEYIAATLAGVFTLPDALQLVATRGRLMQALPPGSMLAVLLDADGVRRYLPDGVAVAAVNTPETCVVSGPTSLIDELATELVVAGVGTTLLQTSHAFHSPMMEPALAAFHDAVAAVPRHAPRMPFLSGLTGDWITEEQATDAAYWTRHLREPVAFAAGVATLLAHGEWLLVECGPGRQLTDLARAQTPKGAPPMPSLPGAGHGDGDWAVLSAAAARLWVAGIELDADALAGGARRVPLPTYPWERKRYWVEPTAGVEDPYAPAQPVAGQRPVDEWFQVPSWRQGPPVTGTEPIDRCLLFTDGTDGLAATLRAAGTEVMTVRPGAGFAEGPDGFTVRPASREDYDALTARVGPLTRVVHAWTATAPPAGAHGAWAAQDLGFFSLLFLVQAIAATQPATPVDLDVLTSGAVAVTGGDCVRPEHATVAGVVRVGPLEAPWLRTRQIDLDSIAHALPALLAPAGDEIVAVRGGRRWLEGNAQAHVPAPADPAQGLRDRGVYVITGGLGGIGITVAEDLARRVRARLVLASRSDLPPRAEWSAYVDVHGTIDRTGRAISAIGRMEAAGAEVLVLAADVTRPDDLRRLRAATTERFGRIDGIVHTAGIPGGGMTEIKTRATAESVLAPKVLGPLALHEVFADLDLDFVAICSSVAGMAGGFGQIDYCAANSFLDSYAHSAHGWPTRVVSIDWSGWAEVGMSAEVAAPEAFRGLQRGERVSPIEHPMLTALHAGDADRLPWCSAVVLPRTQWVLGEHRLMDTPLMPGTGYLELARRAFTAVAPAKRPGLVVELRDVAFVEWLAVPDDTAVELRVTFAPNTDGLDFEVRSLAAGIQRVHVRGSAAWADPGPAPAADIAAVRARCSLAVREVSGLSDVSNSGLITFGSRWHSLRTVHRGQSEALARLDAADVVAAELPAWGLHPAMLDEATSFGQMSGEYLPIGYGRIVVRGPLRERMWSHWRYHDSGGGEVVAADLSIMDDDGTEILGITDYLWRRIDPDTVTSTVSRGVAAAARPPDEHDADRLMRPTDGADALHRLLANDLGRQVSITVVPLDELIPHIREVTQHSVETGLDTGAAADRPGGPHADGAAPGATSELEAALLQIWADVLGLDAIGLDDEFFELGGNSLVAVQLIALVRKRLSVRLPMRDVFNAPTIAGMAATVERVRAAAQPAAAAPSTIPRLERPQ